MPKLAIFASTIDEAVSEVQPAVEKILAELGVPLSAVLVNVGDTKYTKEEDIRHFNNLDVAGTEGSRKQFLILVNKGREGWNCRSLFGVALFRSPSSKIFVLQATMRCLRKITDEQQTATVFLSKDNFDTLNDELNKNFNMDIKELKEPSKRKRQPYQVRVLPPPRKIKLRSLHREYSLIEKGYTEPVDFGLPEMDLSKYETKVYEKSSISSGMSVKETVVDEYRENVQYSQFSLVGEVARYLNLSPVLINRILAESVGGVEQTLKFANRHNDLIQDVLIPKIWNALYEVTHTVKSEEKELVLLREPKQAGYYEFSANPDLVVRKGDPTLQPDWESRSFHADTYCFDSKPERECFYQYVSSDKVSEVYFTGMFTSEQGDLSVQYYDPEMGRIRRYYPDFFAKMKDGTYQIIEVKGDNKIDDELVKIKEAAAREIAVESGVEYVMYAGSVLMRTNVLENEMTLTKQHSLIDEMSI